jgi:alkanesulfonate monooxygenase SsuD/methylene tetrahydromethanopterin reductase-like flavin-dependent oxidoreductase (luciferase family)
MLGLVARRADEWNMWSLPAELIERSTELDRCCERIGRDPKTIVRSTQALVYLSDDATKAKRLADAVAPRQVVAGSVEKLADVVGQWRDAGVDEVIIPDWVLGKGARRLDAMDQILEGVVAHFR